MKIPYVLRLAVVRADSASRQRDSGDTRQRDSVQTRPGALSAAGISDGLGLGYNARAALITRGLAEITRLGLKLGGRKPNRCPGEARAACAEATKFGK